MASVGGTRQYFYIARSADVHLIRLAPKTVALNVGGTPLNQPAGPATSPFWVRANKNKNEYGLDARSVDVCFNEANVPDGAIAGRRYPVTILDPGAYDGIQIGDTVTYLEAQAEVLGKTPEAYYPGIG